MVDVPRRWRGWESSPAKTMAPPLPLTSVLRVDTRSTIAPNFRVANRHAQSRIECALLAVRGTKCDREAPQLSLGWFSNNVGSVDG
jgi:hypothetical protein